MTYGLPNTPFYPQRKSDQQWLVLAKKQGLGNDLRLMILKFNVSGSAEEAMARVEAELAVNEAFRLEYRGWSFFAVRGDRCIRVADTGAVHIHHDEKESASTSAPERRIYVGGGA